MPQEKKLPRSGLVQQRFPAYAVNRAAETQRSAEKEEMKHLLICDNTKPEAVVELCRKHNCGIEAQAFFHYEALSNERLIAATREQVRDLPLIAMHGPFGDLNPGSFDPLIREVTARRIHAGLDAAAGIGAEHVVFHDGRVPAAGPATPWIKRSITFWKEVMGKASEGTHVYLENFLEDPDILQAIVDGVECPNLHANLDIGHAHCNSRISVVEWIVTLGNRIGYVHLHDNHGEQDEHLGFGKGTIPMLEVFRALEEHAPYAIWALEAEGDGIGESLAWLDKHDLI
jgi:sugar phosphate isomerase/epimerase